MAELVLEKKKKPAWFLKLLEDLKGLLGKEKGYMDDLKKTGKMLLEAKHIIGRRIIDEQKRSDFYDVFESIPIYMKTLSKELGISETELYAYVKLVEKFPDKGMLSDVGEHSWRYIEHEILYPPKKPVERESEPLPAQLEKMCGLENALDSLRRIVNVKRPETLKCEDCPPALRAYCVPFMAKLQDYGVPKDD